MNYKIVSFKFEEMGFNPDINGLSLPPEIAHLDFDAQTSAVSAPAELSAEDESKAVLMGRFVGALGLVVPQLAVFHPLDLVSKRLQVDTSAGTSKKGFVANWKGMSDIIFRGKHGQAGFLELYKGVKEASFYKSAQIVHKFMGQLYIKDHLKSHYGDEFQSVFGPTWAPVMMGGLAGGFAGVTEVWTLPLDRLKVAGINRPETLAGKSYLQNLRALGLREGYRGIGVTMGRNFPGSFYLFGGMDFVYHGIFNTTFKEANEFQVFAASVAGATASIGGTHPFDTIKTRLQSQVTTPGIQPLTGGQIFRNLLRTEGPLALFKGAIPKLASAAPKQTFNLFVVQNLMKLSVDSAKDVMRWYRGPDSE
jgi:hypothetical protein